VIPIAKENLMKNIVFSLVSFSFLLIGCTNNGQTTVRLPAQQEVPAILNVDCDKVLEKELHDFCVKEQTQAEVERWRETHQESMSKKNVDHRSSDDMPELPVEPPPRRPLPDPYPPGGAPNVPTVQAEFLPNGDDGCMPGWNLSVPNNSTKYLEVVGTDLRLCGGEGVVEIFVSTPNGGIRSAYVIPPDVTGKYYFYPWRDVGGTPVSTKGKKEYTINVYEAGSIQGIHPVTPSVKLVAMKLFVTVPHDGVWWRNPITDQKIKEYRATH
jgi:hypothetical protein